MITSENKFYYSQVSMKISCVYILFINSHVKMSQKQWCDKILVNLDTHSMCLSNLNVFDWSSTSGIS